MVNPAGWSWRVTFLAVVALAAPLATVFEEESTERLPFILGCLAVGLVYAALAWRARDEQDAFRWLDMIVILGFVGAALRGLFWDATASRAPGRVAALILGLMLGVAWRARRQARRAAQA